MAILATPARRSCGGTWRRLTERRH
jgi:hypothetical protein